MNTILTKEESKKILDSRRDGILCIPEGISVITQESLQLFTGQDNPDLRHPKYYFTKIIILLYSDQHSFYLLGIEKLAFLNYLITP